MKKTISSFEWEKTFPPVYSHTSVSFLKNCPGFSEAKNGNARAAAAVVNLCVKQPRLAEIRKKYPAAVLIPVMTTNRLPEALAKAIGLPVHTGIQMQHITGRKNMSGMERLLYKPEFAGKIVKNKNYILVDDIVSQGGTISALRKYVLSQGGSICAVAALASAGINGILSPRAENIETLLGRFEPQYIKTILNQYDISDEISELTNSEIHYLLRFKQTENIIAKINGCLYGNRRKLSG